MELECVWRARAAFGCRSPLGGGVDSDSRDRFAECRVAVIGRRPGWDSDFA